MLSSCPEDWVVKVDNHFQYGQQNKNGDNRWLVLQDKSNKMFQVRKSYSHQSRDGEKLNALQHRFIVATVQGKAAGWAKAMATSAGAGKIAESINGVGSSFVGNPLHDF